jgi:thioesterase domain-containing protein/acyl carrier protein
MPKAYLPGAAVPIGKPLLGYGAFVTDKFKRVLPLGVAGELLVTGPAVAEGYLNSEQKEKEVFVQLYLPTSKSLRGYCTGDRVVLNSQLNVNYLGRRDNQVKIRGFRVELQEVEHAVEALTGSKQCVACFNGPERYQNQLIAFVLGSIGSSEELKASLSQNLPSYMVPSSIFEIENIPLTSNGKTDNKALWNLALAQQSSDNDTIAEPSNEVEAKMLDVWREVLGLEKLGVTHDFFESGGHSLKAVSLITKLHKLFQVNLPLASLITHPTVRQLAQLVSSGKPSAQWQCLVPIRAEGRKTPLFLVHGAGLNVLLYQSLGKNLQPNRPIYALQAKGLDGKQQISTSISEMASDYIAEIQQVQPKGPYLLFGFSLGGFIAFEMAKQLLAKGEEVRFLGVIDTVTYAAHEDLPIPHYLLRQFKLLVIKPLFIVWMFLLEPWEAKGKYLATKYGNLRHEVLYQLMKRGIIRTASLRKQKATDEEPLPIFQKAQVAITIYNALKTYTLRPTQLLLDLFRAEKKAFYIPERKTYGWGRFATKGVKVHNIPGEHSLIFAPPNDKLFAGILDKRLDELEAAD